MASGWSEKERLLEKQRLDSTGSYGSDTGTEVAQSQAPAHQEATSCGAKEEASGQGGAKVASKRERLTRNPSLEKLDEDQEKERHMEKEKPKSGKKSAFGCSDYFGVKSYLHTFYDTHFYKDPSVYEEEEDFRYLLEHPRRRKCTSIWWKVFVWIGANFLVFGIIGVLIGYLVPQRPIIVDTFADNIVKVDKEAISFNFNLDVCKLVGLILFCIGGLTLTVALLFPSFLYNYCVDDRREAAIKVNAIGGDEQLKSPLEMSIPIASKVTEIQPVRKPDESLVTQEGMVAIKE